MPPPDAGRAGRAAGLALVAVVLRHAGRQAARRGARADLRVAIAVTALDAVVTTGLLVRRRRADRRRLADAREDAPLASSPEAP